MSLPQATKEISEHPGKLSVTSPTDKVAMQADVDRKVRLSLFSFTMTPQMLIDDLPRLIDAPIRRDPSDEAEQVPRQRPDRRDPLLRPRPLPHRRVQALQGGQETRE